VELFFKWIKQHLKIKSFWEIQKTLLKSKYELLVAIVKRELKIKRTIYEILQILSVSAFEKTPLDQILNQEELQNLHTDPHNQLPILDL